MSKKEKLLHEIGLQFYNILTIYDLLLLDPKKNISSFIYVIYDIS